MTAKENLLRVIRHDHPLWVPYLEDAPIRTVDSAVVERPWHGAGRDDFGVLWDIREDAQGGSFPAHGGHTVADLSRWQEQVQFPDIASLDWDSRAREAAAIDRDAFLVQGFVHIGLLERVCLLLGMEEALAQLMLAPEQMEALVAALADWKIRVVETFNGVAPLDLLWYGDDWGNQDRLLMKPDLWRRIIKPHTMRIYDRAKRLGILVNQHSCGRIEEIFPDIVEMGVDILNPCQPCNDLAAMKRAGGERITFCGAIDSQFVLDRPGATPAEVRAEVRRRIDELAAGGGYIAAPSHSVPYAPEIVAAMKDEIASYGRAIYTDGAGAAIPT